jgi:hypothetical protein
MKVRASQIGKIMTSPKTKGELLSKTAKTYIHEIILREKYGINKEFSSRYTDKGNQVEDIAIAMANEVLDVGFIYKNSENLQNDWITGTPDVITDEILLDVKCSWDATTFPFFETEIPTKDYFYQLQGYMWLTDKTESLLIYCLVDTPLEIVEDEIRRAHWKFHKLDEDLELRQEIECKHIFANIPMNKRIKIFEVKRDEKVIEQIKEKIEVARLYYDSLYKIL